MKWRVPFYESDKVASSQTFIGRSPTRSNLRSGLSSIGKSGIHVFSIDVKLIRLRSFFFQDCRKNRLIIKDIVVIKLDIIF
jgi:hypothetical protein